MKANIVKVKISQIRISFFVREELNEDHALHLAELIENGVKLPPILVTDKFELVDGRHRLRGYELHNCEEVLCEVIPTAKKSELVMMAISRNVGGSLPPSRKDIAFSIRLLLEEKVSRRYIIEHLHDLTGFPQQVIQNYLDKVQGDMANSRVRLAVRSVLSGVTIQKAAELHNVKVESLKRELDPEKKKDKRIPCHKLKAGMSTSARVFSTGMAKICKATIRDFMDGIVTEEEVRGLFKHFEHLSQNISNVHHEWSKRYNSIVDNMRQGSVMEAEALFCQPTPQSGLPNKTQRVIATSVLSRIVGD